MITSMDVTKTQQDGGMKYYPHVIPYLDYFLPSEEQAMLLAGTEDVEAMADFFLKGGVKCVVIKLGSRGCFCKTAQLSFYCGCYDVPVVETTGAGDAFVAGFLSGVLRNGSMEDCVRLGGRCFRARYSMCRCQYGHSGSENAAGIYRDASS